MRHRRHDRRCPAWNRMAKAAIALLVPGLLVVGAAEAQTGNPSGDPFAAVGMSTEPSIRMSTLFEVTVFRIDVMRVEVRIPMNESSALGRMAGSGGDSDVAADSVAAAVLDVEHMWARQEMLRDFGFGRFIDGITETVDRAVEAGWVSPEYRASLEPELSELFSFLEERGGRRGDEIFYEVSRDSVRTVYRAADGAILMDDTTAGPEARTASVPSFFAPGTPFREGLVESLLEGEAR